MKKTLLLLAAALGAQVMLASTPAVYYDFQFTGVAPNGTLAGSFLYGNASIMNPKTGEIFNSYNCSDDMAVYYTEGLGNCVSNTGVLTGSTFMTNNAAYWRGGAWTTLYTPKPQYTNMTNGITADGLTICGNIGLEAMSLEDVATPMLVPAVWELQSDGTYGSPKTLPYPSLDFTGRVPQYVTAVAISDDAKTIAGQVVDYSGQLTYPIIYTKDENGEWSYSTEVGLSLVNPNNIKFPEWPGDSPSMPTLDQFMAPDEVEAYNQDLNDWFANGMQGDAPELEDYATEEEIAAFNAAMAKWQAYYDEWLPKYKAFDEALQQLLADPDHKSFQFNSVSLSPDGKTYVTTAQTEIPNPDPMGRFPFITINSALTINVADGTVTNYPADGMNTVQALNDGTIIGFVENSLGIKQAAMYLPGSTTVTKLEDYVQEKNPDLYAWMKENMNFDVEYPVFNPETEEYEDKTENMWFTGVPHATTDLSMFLTTTENMLGIDDCMTYGYVLPMDYTSGIENVATDVDSELPVEYYTLDGIRVNDASKPGLYIMRQGNKTTKVMVK